MDMSNVFASDILSRAFDIEEEEEQLDDCEEERCSFKFEWESHALKKFCTELLICTGYSISGFVEICVSQNMKVIGIVQCVESSKRRTHVFELKGTGMGHFYVIYIDKLMSHELHGWTREVLEKLCDVSSRVSVVTLENASRYRGLGPDSPENFVRTLYSRRALPQIHFKYLDEPTLVEGLPAQFLMQAEVDGMSCSVYIIYSRDPSPYSFILDFFEKLHFNNISEIVDHGRMLSLKKRDDDSFSGLYM